jgi:hypothetical protein
MKRHAIVLNLLFTGSIVIGQPGYCTSATGISTVRQSAEFSKCNEGILAKLLKVDLCVQKVNDAAGIQEALDVIATTIEELKNLSTSNRSVAKFAGLSGKIENLHIMEDILNVFLEMVDVKDNVVIEEKLNEDEGRGRWLLKAAKQYHNNTVGKLVDELFVTAKGLSQDSNYTFADVICWLSAPPATKKKLQNL